MDITKLPVLQGVIVFLLVAIGAAFVGAFMATEDDNGEAVSGNGEPTATPATVTIPPDAIAVSMGDNFFDPDQFTVTAGEAVTFGITNNGAALHNMRIAGEDGEYGTADDAISAPDSMSAGQTGVLEWTVPAAAGAFDFRCDFHPVEMVGTITAE